MSEIPNEKILTKMEELLNVASDYTRLKILYAIMVSHQLKVLKKANLVSTHKEGTKVYYKLADDHVNSLLKVVQEHAEE